MPYSERILNTRSTSLIGYWRLDDASSQTATDYSPQNNHGSYSSVAIGQAGIGDNRLASSFDGTNSFVNIYSAALNSDFSGAAGTLLVWAKVANAGVWTDNTARWAVGILADANNLLRVMKWTDNALYLSHAGGGTLVQVAIVTTPTEYFSLAMTWSAAADELKGYLNGVQSGVTQTGLGTWTGSLAATGATVGASNTTPSNPWSGSIAHCALWNVALTASEVGHVSAVMHEGGGTRGKPRGIYNRSRRRHGR